MRQIIAFSNVRRRLKPITSSPAINAISPSMEGNENRQRPRTSERADLGLNSPTNLQTIRRKFWTTAVFEIRAEISTARLSNYWVYCKSMALDVRSETIKGPLINATAVVLSALITAGTTILVTWMTGHLTTPADIREFQKTKQENEGLKQENAGLRQENAGLKQQNASLHDEIAKTQSDSSNNSQAQEGFSPESTTERADDLVSRLHECHKTTSSVMCVVRVMNVKEDRVARLYNDWTSIVDLTGNEQKARVARLGASTNPYPWAFAETTLPTNVAVRATVTFGRVDPNVSRLSILTIGIQCPGATPEREQIQFRDIPLVLQR